MFETTSSYDGAIADWMFEQLAEEDDSLEAEGEGEFPDYYDLYMVKQQGLRYGENPHQEAAFYRLPDFESEHSLVNAEQLNGKELSYNNILDTDACWSLVREFDEPRRGHLEAPKPMRVGHCHKRGCGLRQGLCLRSEECLRWNHRGKPRGHERHGRSHQREPSVRGGAHRALVRA